jgi:hypothetical protein
MALIAKHFIRRKQRHSGEQPLSPLCVFDTVINNINRRNRNGRGA